jgi:hypothetical protein
MKKYLLILLVIIISSVVYAQDIYTMGYKVATIDVVDDGYFSLLDFPGQEPICGVYDKPSMTFYTCNYRTFRYVEEDFISKSDAGCCSQIDFDPARYYGTLTMMGYIEHVEWDSMVVYFKADQARVRIETDEREIDALYEKFYKQYHLGKVHLILRLKTYDTPMENELSYNKITEVVPKPKRTNVKILRW